MSLAEDIGERDGDAPPVLMIGGLACVADPSGALYLADERLLVVADLHLEKGSAFAARGVTLEPLFTRRDLGV